MDLTIALLQFKPTRKSIEKNIQKIQRAMEGIKADLIVLPELSNSGYLYEKAEDLKPFSEENDGQGPFLSALIDISKTIEGVIVTGYAEKDRSILYNSAIALSPQGPITNYRKTHLYDHEKMLFHPGDSGFKVFEWNTVKIGMMICFDWIFPEACRSLALEGAQIIAHPANLVLPYCQNAMVTRSIENRVFTITANRIGTEKLGDMNLNFTGMSQITDPSGAIRYRGPKDKATVHIITIDPNDALDKNLNPQNNLFKDRRLDLYQLVESREQ
ncbi:MAG: nitrilase-related carbon-nitrogen hydrolase [Brevefilum sp.]|nr:nitrilase-related carbon-nitrogen hydrolase [Brevefilum sp.]MDW7754643.1 nitrilase-related carbon-nitrogen hydrolase [Brevefilum sp.]